MTGNHRTAENEGSRLTSDPRQQNGTGNKNIETPVNNPGYFDDDYESGVEDEISEDEAKTENEGSAGKQ